MSKTYYPLFADLEGRRCVVVGGGIVAQRKVAMLLRCGAAVTVVSPELTLSLSVSAQRGRIRHIHRRFRPSDVRGAWLVYAATDDQRINEQIYETATRLRIFTNVVDQKPLCSFIAPAIFTRGPMTVAVSTGGASPSLSKKIRDELAQRVGTEYVPLLQLLANLRGIAKRRLPHYDDRKRYFDQIVRGHVVELIRAGKRREARAEALSLLAGYTSNGRH
jgi:uroporphyrin-III C-methyltransferase/precorrin-2 dehydrogenase/sirohydrochlorin ferrochelatase